MLNRLTDFVERGSIDNRVRDRVRIELFMRGRETPVLFILEGNCRRDIAGCLTEFSIKEEYASRLLTHSPCKSEIYHGLVGDISASRRGREFGNGRKLSNILYIEIYAEEQGLLLLESDRFEIKVSDFEWMLDSGEEQAQIMCNQQVMRDYVHNWVKKFSVTHDEPSPLPDHRWDVRLREAEGIAIAFQEVHFKYRHVACGDTSEAFVMGWDDMLGELADSEETGVAFCCRISGSLSLFDILDDEEAIDAQLCMSHPIFQQVIGITEMAQKLFAKQINDLQVSRKPPSEELGIVFSSIRYVTPNILSCLLQINEGGGSNEILAERMERCAQHIAKVIGVVPGIKVKGIKKFHDLMTVLYEDVLNMSNDLHKQGKL